jgi:uncharacterized protein
MEVHAGGGDFVMNPLRSEVPSVDQCHLLLREYHVPRHIVQHSQMVCRVAGFLAAELNNRGENLSIPEIEAAALLHDMTKMEGLKTTQDHAHTGMKLLANLGFKRIGEIVVEHIRLQEGRLYRPLSEEEIINYSDKRVLHTRVVPLAERFADLRKRYGNRGSDKGTIERIVALEGQTYELERKIFAKLSFAPEQLSGLMESASTG